MPLTRIYDGTEWVPIEGATAAGPHDHAGVYLPLIGGTMTGPLILDANPSAALGAATKQYVDLIDNHTKYTDANARAAVDNGTYLKLTGGTLTGGLQINAGLNMTGNLTIGESGVELFRYLRNFRGVAGDYAQFWAGAGGNGLNASGGIIRYHNGSITVGDYYHGSQQPGGRGLHNPPGASIANGFTWQSMFVDAARRTAWRRVSASRQEIAVMSNLGSQLGALMFDHLTGDIMVGVTPRTNSQLRNVSHSSTDSVPSGTQPGDIFIVYQN